MSRKGNCWDNAVAERFFLNLKMERVSLGIDLMQGFLFARPTFKVLASVDSAAWPAVAPV
jgi:transposase InsO family protein